MSDSATLFLPPTASLAEMVRDYGLTLDLSLAQLRTLELRTSALVAAGEHVADLVADFCGPAPGAVAGQVRTLVLQGSGYHRAVRDGVRAMLAGAARRKKFRPSGGGKGRKL